MSGSINHGDTVNSGNIDKVLHAFHSETASKKKPILTVAKEGNQTVLKFKYRSELKGGEWLKAKLGFKEYDIEGVVKCLYKDTSINEKNALVQGLSPLLNRKIDHRNNNKSKLAKALCKKANSIGIDENRKVKIERKSYTGLCPSLGRRCQLLDHYSQRIFEKINDVRVKT